VSAPTDRDSAIERLLPRALDARASASADACLDAETAAAWADDELAADQRTAVETHAADCARCRALLAAMVTTAPVEARPSRARSLALGWLIPLGAVAAAVILWVAVPGRAPAVRERAEPPAHIAEAKPPSSPPPAPSAEAKDAPAQPVRPLARRETNPVSAAPESMAAQKAKPSAAPAEEKKDIDAIAPRDSANAAAPVAAGTLAQGAAAPRLKSEARAFSASAMPVIVSPDPAIQWRLSGGGVVQRTVDGGASWETEQTCVADTLTAGAAPSSTVCWLAGPHGIVLLSTDGRTWRRVATPEDAPLVKVSAEDDRSATVTAADGRTFSTSDAGQTWSRPR
jgi:hypothetical protein